LVFSEELKKEQKMILQKVADLMDIACDAINKKYNEIRVCELGDQRMKWHPLLTGKKYLMEEKGVIEHISIDTNARNGAIPLDLASPIDKWNGYFDFVTNYGTTEHVYNQFEVFRNIHNFTRVGGAMIHTVPIIGGWAKHCNIHYGPRFFVDLAGLLNYNVAYAENRIVDGRWRNQPEIDKTLVCAVLIKKEDNIFVSMENFLNLKGLEIK